MKNKFEGYCYVCGEVVPEEQGLAEQLPRKPGDAGWGKTKWSVRHTTCTPQGASASDLCAKCGKPIREIGDEVDGQVIESEAWHQCKSTTTPAERERMMKDYLRSWERNQYGIAPSQGDR